MRKGIPIGFQEGRRAKRRRKIIIFSAFFFIGGFVVGKVAGGMDVFDVTAQDLAVPLDGDAGQDALEDAPAGVEVQGWKDLAYYASSFLDVGQGLAGAFLILQGGVQFRGLGQQLRFLALEIVQFGQQAARSGAVFGQEVDQVGDLAANIAQAGGQVAALLFEGFLMGCAVAFEQGLLGGDD